MFICFLTRLRAPGRLRRHVPRRDQADRARGADHRRHPRHPAAGGAAGRARAREHAPVHAGRRPPRRRRPGRRRACGGRSRSATATGALFVGPDNGLLLPAAERAGIDRRARAREPRLRARLDLAHVPRSRPLRAGRRAPRERRAARGARARRSTRTRSCGSTCPSRAFARRPDRRDDALRRQLRQHRAQPDPRRRRARRASSRARGSSSSCRASATTPSPRGRSPTPGPGT